jgi:hypothetical protein
MEDTSETSGSLGSGPGSKPGIAYDQERLGEPGDPGVPAGDQYPTNERDNIAEGGHGGVGIDDPPGTHPPGESLSPGSDPTKAERNAGSLGDLTEDVSTSEAAAAKDVANSDDPYSDEHAEQQQATKHSEG